MGAMEHHAVALLKSEQDYSLLHILSFVSVRNGLCCSLIHWTLIECIL